MKLHSLLLIYFHILGFTCIQDQFLADENVKLTLFREKRYYSEAKVFCQEANAEMVVINSTQKEILLKTLYELQFSVKPKKNQLIWFNNEEEYIEVNASCKAFTVVESKTDNTSIVEKNCMKALPFVCEASRRSPDWKTFKNYSYHITQTNLSRNEAISHCKSLANKTNLAFAVFPEVLRFLFVELLDSQERSVWIEGEYIIDNKLWYFSSVQASYLNKISPGSSFEKCLSLKSLKDDNTLIVSDCNEELNSICHRPKREEVLESFNCNRKYYELYKNELNVHEARSACQEKGEKLAQPNREQLVCFHEAIQNLDEDIKVWVDGLKLTNETCQSLYAKKFTNPILQSLPCDKNVHFICEFDEDFKESPWKTFGDDEYKLIKKNDGSEARMECIGSSIDQHLVLVLDEDERRKILPILSKITDDDLTEFIYVQGNYIVDKAGWLFPEIEDIVSYIPNLEMDTSLEHKFSCLKYKIPNPELQPSDCNKRLNAICSRPKNDTSLVNYSCGIYLYELFLSVSGVNNTQAEEKCQDHGYKEGLADLSTNPQLACLKIIYENLLEDQRKVLIKSKVQSQGRVCLYVEHTKDKLRTMKTDCAEEFFNYLCMTTE